MKGDVRFPIEIERVSNGAHVTEFMREGPKEEKDHEIPECHPDDTYFGVAGHAVTVVIEIELTGLSP